MVRILTLWMSMAALLAAQNAPAQGGVASTGAAPTGANQAPVTLQIQPGQLATLRAKAARASTEWIGLASTLESRISRLLPCDPKAKSAIEEASRASEARLSALTDYLRAAAEKAQADVEAAKLALGALATLGGGWATERAEAEQDIAAIEGQMGDLNESVLKRPTLEAAQKSLLEIAQMTKSRIAKADDQVLNKDKLNLLMGNLVIACQNRQTAIVDEISAVEIEAARWSAYYSARLARTQTECAITNPSGSAGPGERRKQR